MTRFLNTVEGVHHRYKASSAVTVRPPERSSSSSSSELSAPQSPRQRTASGSFDNICASPGRLFRRILPHANTEEGALALRGTYISNIIPNKFPFPVVKVTWLICVFYADVVVGEDFVPLMELPPVVILPQAVLPSVIYALPSDQVADETSQVTKWG